VAAAETVAAASPRPVSTASGSSSETALILTSPEACTLPPGATCASTVLPSTSARTAASTVARATLPATAAPSRVSCPVAVSETLPAGALTWPATATLACSWRKVPAIDAPAPAARPNARPPARVVEVTSLVAASETFPVLAVRCEPLPTVTCTVLGALGSPALIATAAVASATEPAPASALAVSAWVPGPPAVSAMAP
jgi:hypothetical protein